MTRVITVACQKGGVGKSTISANLMVSLEEIGHKVAGLSLDTQGSLVLWAHQREAAGKSTTVLPLAPNKVGAAIRDAREAGIQSLVIDTPPTRSTSDLDPAIAGADLVIVPTGAELFDIAAAKPTVDLCRKHGTKFLIVLSRAPAPLGFGEPQVLRDARAALGGLGMVFTVPVVQRRAHSVAMAAGMGVTEGNDDKAAREIRALRDFVMEV